MHLAVGRAVVRMHGIHGIPTYPPNHCWRSKARVHWQWAFALQRTLPIGNQRCSRPLKVYRVVEEDWVDTRRVRDQVLHGVIAGRGRVRELCIDLNIHRLIDGFFVPAWYDTRQSTPPQTQTRAGGW